MSLHRVWTRLSAALLVCAVAALALADRESAEFFADRGSDALRKRDHAEAIVQFKKALEEDAGYHPARLGLAEAYLADDQKDVGLVELRRFVGSVRGDEQAADEWKSELKKAERLLSRIDAVGSELEERLDEHRADLRKFARKWQKKDPAIAIRALRQALAIDPNDEDAIEMIEALGASPKGEPVQLFNGRNLDGFTEMAFPTWKVEEGYLVGELKDGAVVGRTEQLFEGDFDVIMEARIVKEHPGPSLYALAPCSDGLEGRYGLGALNGRIFWEESIDEDSDRDITFLPPSTFQKDEWNTFELRLRGDKAIAYLNGEELGVDERPERRMKGFVGLVVQNCVFQIRRLEVVPR